MTIFKKKNVLDNYYYKAYKKILHMYKLLKHAYKIISN